MEHQLSTFLRVAMPPAIRLLYGITQDIPASDMATIKLDRDQMETRLRKHFKVFSYTQFFGDYAVDLNRIGIALPEPGTAIEDTGLTEDLANIMRAADEYDGHVGHIANRVSKLKKVVLEGINKLIALGFLDDDGKPTELGTAWIEVHPEAEPEAVEPKKKPKARKPVATVRSTDWHIGDPQQFVNLRCPRCKYFAKTTTEMMTYGRLKCPVEGEMLLMKGERGEKKGRW